MQAFFTLAGKTYIRCPGLSESLVIAYSILFVFTAQDALNIMHPLLKVCSLSQATPQSKAKARRCTGQFI